MRILTALLCVAYTSAYMVTPDSPDGPIMAPFIKTLPRLVMPDDSLHMVPNVMPYWSDAKPRKPLPHSYYYRAEQYLPHHHDFLMHHMHLHPFDFIPPFKFPFPGKPSEHHPVPEVHEPSNEGNVPEPHDDKIQEQFPEQAPLYPSKEKPFIAPASNIEKNLKAAIQLAAELKDDTRFDGSMTFLDTTPHYNALLGVVIALAEEEQASAAGIDFDSYYDDNYLRAVEEHYPNGLLNPDAISQKVEYYTDLFDKNIRKVKKIVDDNCIRFGVPCNRLDFMMEELHSHYPELVVLEALADLAVAYDKLSVDLVKVSGQYLELPYLLEHKDDLKGLARKLHRALELATHNTLPEPCQETHSALKFDKLVPWQK